MNPRANLKEMHSNWFRQGGNVLIGRFVCESRPQSPWETLGTEIWAAQDDLDVSNETQVTHSLQPEALWAHDIIWTTPWDVQ